MFAACCVLINRSTLGTDPLAYLTAKTNGLDDVALEILEAAGLTEADIDDVPSFGISTLRPPPVITSTTDLNWPSVSTGESFFDRALANGNLDGGDVPYVNGYDAAGAAASAALDNWAREEEAHDEPDPEEGGWELDAGVEDAQPDGDKDEEFVDAETELGAGAAPGVSENELWTRNSPFAADHVAGGSFDSAMQVSTMVCICKCLSPTIYIRSYSIANLESSTFHCSSLYSLLITVLHTCTFLL